MKLSRLASAGFLLSALLAPASAQAPATQCVTSAIAGGTSDALTLPLLPCSVTTSLVIVKITATNTTTSPTMQMVGALAEPIKRSDGTVLAVGELLAGDTILFTNNGSVWTKLTGGAGSGPLMVNDASNAALPAARTNLGIGLTSGLQLKGLGLGTPAPTTGLAILGLGAASAPLGSLVSSTQTLLAPSGVIPTFREITAGLGDNTTFKGVSGRIIVVGDDASVTPTTKGVLYGLQISMQPKTTRNNSPFDDVASIVIANDGTVPSIVESIFFGHNAALGTGNDWGSLLGGSANADNVIGVTGKYGVGFNAARDGATRATFSRSFILTNNNIPLLASRNAADNADVEVVRVDASNRVSLGGGTLLLDPVAANNLMVSIPIPDNAAAAVRFAETLSGGNSIPGFEAVGARPDANTTYYGRFQAGHRRSDGTAIASGSGVGGLLFGGQWGTDLTLTPAKVLYPASIVGIAEGSFTAANAMPTGISFRTGSTGDAAMAGNGAFGTERWRIDATGGLYSFGATGSGKGAGTINPAAGYYLNGVLLASTTAPVIASGGCTTGSAQSISASNGSAAFEITLGGATCGSTITLTLPAAPHNWVCDAHDITNPATNVLDMTGSASTTAVVLTNFVRTTGVAGNFTGADKLAVKCLPY